MKRFFILVATLLALVLPSRAAEFSVTNVLDGVTDTLFQNGDGSLLNGGVVAIGYFPAGFTPTTPADAVSHFTTLASAICGSPSPSLGGSFPGYVEGPWVWGQFITDGNPLIGRPLYVFVGNAATLAASTSFGLQQNATIGSDVPVENYYAAYLGGAPAPLFGKVGSYTGDAGGQGSSTFPTLQLTISPMPASITAQPVSLSANQGSGATFSVTASGGGPYTYQWKKAGLDISDATSATLTLNNVQPSDAGDYTVMVSNVAGTVTSNAATLTVIIPPSITLQPLSVTLNQGSNTTFSVTATGSSVSYQWKKAQTNIPGATATTLSISNVQAADAGSYTVTVSNAAGSVTTVEAILTVIVPPSIMIQPLNTAANQGANATFSMTVTGGAPYTYQWKKAGLDISDATSATLTLNNVQPSDAGDYTVVVSNAAGVVTSDAATLTVLVPPSITAQPVGASLYLGDAITLAVTAAGSGPLSYQWKKDGIDVAGANDASWALNPVLATNAGTYTVMISNAAGSVTSNAAIVAATADLRDSDGDGLTNYDEVFVDHTNPNLADTDGDGLTDGYEAGMGRFSLVLGTFTWEQARVSALAQGGRLATFTSETEWNRVLGSLGTEALWDVNGLWIGANDAAVEGTWAWVTGEPFSFASWATGQPDNLNNSDYAAVSGDLGGETGKWYDFRGVTTRDGYILEIGYTTDPRVADADGDGLNDEQEQAAGSNPFVADTDGDGLTDREEVEQSQTDPRLADSNGNGTNDAADDADGDGLTNLVEIRTNLTNPVVADTDGDGLSDGTEVQTYLTNPLVADTDGDGYSDGYEVTNASNPAVAESVPTFTLTLTDDGVATGGRFSKTGSLAHGTMATLAVVVDSGEVFDGWTGDLTGSTNPQTLLMDGNKRVGATFINDVQDSDADGLSNYAEAVIHGTNLNLADTDGDGYSDGYEVANASNPAVAGSVPTFTLTLTDGGVATGGRFTESGSLAHGTTATLTVVVDSGYVFDGWTGDLTGSTNPQTLLMDSNKTVGAKFINDIQDPDGDGLSNYAEAVIHGTNLNLADTDNDGLNDRAELETYHTNPKVVDSNGDDLPDGMAVALGLDPLADHAAVAQTIRQTSHTMGLYSEQQLTDLRPGSTTVKVLPSAGGVQLRLKVQESSDLQNWQDAGEAVFEKAADPAAPKKFFRIGLK